MRVLVLCFAAALGPASAADVPADDAFNFLVMGDWGGVGSPPYTTPEELATAAGMGEVAGQIDAKFAMALGDNFYSEGITTDEHDMRFDATFEKVFTSNNLMGDDFFRVLLGNHDHYGNVTAQVEYSKHSKRWRMDDLYWSFEETVSSALKDASTGEVGAATLKVINIDTCTLCGFAHYTDPLTGEQYSPKGSELPGPHDQSFADDQMAWIEDQLQGASGAEYIIVAGHYPVYSICEHGPTSCLVSQLKPLLEKYEVSAYLNGHDHCQEHIEVNNIAYHTMGSAHVNDPSTAHKSAIPDGSLKFHVGTSDGKGGFGIISIDGEGLHAQHVTASGKVIYSAPVVKVGFCKGRGQQRMQSLPCCLYWRRGTWSSSRRRCYPNATTTRNLESASLPWDTPGPIPRRPPRP